MIEKKTFGNFFVMVYKNGQITPWLLSLGMNGRPERSGGHSCIVWRGHRSRPQMQKP